MEEFKGPSLVVIEVAVISRDANLLQQSHLDARANSLG